MHSKILSVWALLAFFAAGPAVANETRTIEVTAMAGQVEYMKGGQGEWFPASVGSVFRETDVVRTGESSTCSLLFHGMSTSTVEMRPGSVLELSTVSAANGDDTELGLTIGSVLVKAEKLQGDSSFQVRTPNSIVGIRGTQFEVNVD